MGDPCTVELLEIDITAPPVTLTGLLGFVMVTPLMFCVPVVAVSGELKLVSVSPVMFPLPAKTSECDPSADSVAEPPLDCRETPFGMASAKSSPPDALYVPAAKYTVIPDLTICAARFHERNGEACDPELLSDPDVLT